MCSPLAVLRKGGEGPEDRRGAAHYASMEGEGQARGKTGLQAEVALLHFKSRLGPFRTDGELHRDR